MSQIHEITKTLTLGSTGAVGYSTGHINGFIDSVYVSCSLGAGSTDIVTVSESTATLRTIIKVADPSTLGAFYHPRVVAVSSSGAAMSSSDGTQAVPFSIYKNKFKVAVVGGTSLNAATVTVRVRWY